MAWCIFAVDFDHAMRHHPVVPTSNETTPKTRPIIAANAARLVAVDAEIAKLMDERERLMTWFGAGSGVSTLGDAGAPVKAKGMHAGSFSSKIVAFLEASPDHVFSIAEIYANIAPAGMDKRRLRSALFDLFSRKPPKIQRLDKGFYQALAVSKEAPA